MSRTVDKLRALLSDFGVLDTLWYCLARLLGRTRLGELHRYLLVAQPVPSVPPRRRQSTVIEVRQIPEQGYDPSWFERPEAVIRERFRQGAVCFVAFREGQAIGCIWLVLGSYLEDEVRCRYLLHPLTETAWDFDVFLHPQHRLGRGFAYLWEYANTWLRERGRRWSLSRIDAFNRDSLRAHRRQGAVVVGQALFIRIAGLQLMLSDRAPHVHLSWHARDLPALRVRAPDTAAPR